MANRKNAIIEATIRRISTQGDTFSTSQIAEDVGCSQALVFRFWVWNLSDLKIGIWWETQIFCRWYSCSQLAGFPEWWSRLRVGISWATDNWEYIGVEKDQKGRNYLSIRYCFWCSGYVWSLSGNEIQNNGRNCFQRCCIGHHEWRWIKEEMGIVQCFQKQSGLL